MWCASKAATSSNAPACAKDADGKVTEVHAKVIPGTKSGTPGADSVKAKAAITWVSVASGVSAEVRLYDRLFTDPQPDAGGKDFLDALNPDSLKVVTAVRGALTGRREAGPEIPV
jgi:glutaminyl-tRNA synthetase